jgi:acyl-CoA synthetase (AMP-forming)/AMP-acid ligase II/acyl carrier protein
MNRTSSQQAPQSSSTEKLCVIDLLNCVASQNPDAVAILAPGCALLTFGRLADLIHDAVHSLTRCGVKRSDRVAIVLPNGPEMAVAFIAASAVAASAPLNPTYQKTEFEFYLSDLKASALITQSDLSPAAAIARAQGIPVIELTPLPELAGGSFTLAAEPSASPVHYRPPLPGEIALVLHTSGTTSKPKLVPLTHANIVSSVFNIARTLRLNTSDKCLNLMPLFHIHGLVGGLLSSLVAGGSVVCPPRFYSTRVFEWIDEFSPTWYTAVPTMHQSILARASANTEIINRRPLRFIRSSSSALPPQVKAQLEEVFAAPVIEAYGMTEASHQIASNPLPPEERKSGSVGKATGVEIAIIGEEGSLLPAGTSGEIVIRGPSVTRGYEENPQANQAAFLNTWFRTGDRGMLDESGYLFIKGRIKEMINRGGEKISPLEVDEVLLSHPSIQQAVTFAVKDVLLGEDVAAGVVVKTGTSVTEREMREFVAERLAYFKVPRNILFLDELPKGPTGKIQRLGLAERLGLTSNRQLNMARAEKDIVAPRSQTEKDLARLFAETLGVDLISIHDNFFELGGDSVMATQVVARVRDSWNMDLTISGFFDMPTIADLAEAMENASTDTSWFNRE